MVDTSLLVAFFDRDDPQHKDARERFEGADHVLILTEVLVEMLGVLKSKVGRKAAEEAMEDLLHMENVGWEETSDLMAAYRLHRRRRTNSVVDALVIDLCLRRGTGALTYDARQARILRSMGL